MEKETGRRDFLKFLGIGAGLLATPAALPAQRRELDGGTAVTHGILVDTRKCVDCKACQVACKTWNGTGTDTTKFKTDFAPETWSYVQEVEKGYYDEKTPTAQYAMVKRQCMHCEDPYCVRYCPLAGKAMHKEPDGPVLVNHDNCIRCKTCVNVCPYGVPKYDAGINKIVKCVFCFGRLRQGRTPACVDTCIAGALTAGKIEDVRAAAEAAYQDGYPVWGLSTGWKTSWIYIFPKGFQPEKILKRS